MNARARESRRYVRDLVARRGWTADVEREALRLVAAALAADLLAGCAPPGSRRPAHADEGTPGPLGTGKSRARVRAVAGGGNYGRR
jgi:hypothetical protein